MANDKLENLARIGQLKPESASEEEIAGLQRSGAVRLKDAKNAELSKESRFDLAYNAAHALSLAALRRAGYRSGNGRPGACWLRSRSVIICGPFWLTGNRYD